MGRPPHNLTWLLSPIDQTSNLKFYAQLNVSVSTAVTSEFVKMTDDKDIKLIYPPANPYSSGGATNLIDDTIFTGFQNWRMVSFEKVNLEAIMDLRVDKSSTTLANRLPKQ